MSLVTPKQYPTEPSADPVHLLARAMTARSYAMADMRIDAVQLYLIILLRA
jgi:hypothetical protein